MENVAAEMRRNRPDVVLGFMGCMAQSRGQELIDRLPDVDLVLGTQKFHHAADYLDEILAGRARKNRGRGGRAGERSDDSRAFAQRQREKIRHRVCQHHAGLQPALHLLHRALHARRGTQPEHSRHRGRMPPACVAGREGNHPARPDRDELWETREYLARPARNERGEGRGEAQFRKRTPHPQPSPRLATRGRSLPSSSSSTPSTKSKDWNASGSPRRIRRATATI